MKKYLYLCGILLITIFYSCSKDDSNPTNPGSSSGTFSGDWTVDKVQIVSAPSGSSASALMKQSLVPLGEVNGSFAGYMNVTFGGQTLQVSTTGISNFYYGSDFYFSGSSGFMFNYYTGNFARTSDAGVTWTNFSLPNSFYYSKSIAIVDMNTLFSIIDTSSTVRALYKSTNAGANWVRVNPRLNFSPYNNSGLNTTYNFVNENTGYCLGTDSISSTSRLFKTTNGGLNWSAISAITSSPSQIKFKDELNGYLVNTGNKFTKTTDGGLTWNDYIVSAALSTSTYIEPFFLGNTGWVGGNENGSYALYKTMDWGTTWTKVGNNLPSSFEFKTETEGYGIFRGMPLKTTNGGANWLPYAAPSNSNMVQVNVINGRASFFNQSGLMYNPTGNSDTAKWVTVGKITNTYISAVTNAPDYDVYANGDFTVSGNTILFTSSNYSQGNDVAAGSGTWAMDSGYLVITLNLPNSEVWKIRLRRL
ncbi:MAG: hypothetical protein K1X86_10350 [Ignavibacteria bacterium]|nr:hypothetical protein [Ignavibacteria bacterium]